MEAASVAWEPLGWKAVGFSEIEPFPCAVLKHRFPNTPNYGSLTEYQSWPLQPGSIDLLVGGTPCQSFSVAGLRKGLADPRGNLALVFLGLADKLKPRWIVWENVPGVLSSNGGRDFGSFVGALEQLGYGWAMRVLDAQYFGVPQRRRRVFVVASLGGRDVAASVLLKPESVCWHPAPRRKKGQATAADAGAGVEAGSPIAFRKSKRAQSTTDNETWVAADASNTLNNFDLGDTRTTHAVVNAIPLDSMCLLGRENKDDPRRGFGVGKEGDPMFTVTKAHHHGVATTMAVRRLTPTECERLQGFPDNWSQIPWKGKPADQCPDGPRYKCAGNSMAVPVMRWIGEQIARVELSLNQPTA
jgi:DNA (cytosine-5)-methyltransferase 1